MSESTPIEPLSPDRRIASRPTAGSIACVSPTIATWTARAKPPPALVTRRRTTCCASSGCVSWPWGLGSRAVRWMRRTCQTVTHCARAEDTGENGPEAGRRSRRSFDQTLTQVEYPCFQRTPRSNAGCAN